MNPERVEMLGKIHFVWSTCAPPPKKAKSANTAAANANSDHAQLLNAPEHPTIMGSLHSGVSGSKGLSTLSAAANVIAAMMHNDDEDDKNKMG